MKRAWLAGLLFFALGCGGSSPRAAHPSSDATPAWSEWSADAFARARREHKPILLSVQAGWCHWCHVMNETTFRDPAVLRELEAHFVVIRADSDARPDLQERYRRYGWPATVFLSPDGTQILGLRGYREPARFAAIIAEVRAAHTEGRTLEEDRGTPSAPAELEAVRAQLIGQLDSMYDEEAGGWGSTQRYPFGAPVEHALFRATVRSEDAWRERALFTLAQYARLIDPVFGGVYQYSVGGVWDRPHFEKIVPVQAGAMRAFAEAYRVTGDRQWLEHARDVHRYVENFLLSEDGGVYVSQDADLGGHGQDGPHVPGPEYYGLDDAGRRALGIPRVDTHVYASTNGTLIEALAQLHVASGRRAPLNEAITATTRILETHRNADDLFVHDARSEDPLIYLADQAHMLAAFVALHQATSDPRWLAEASRLVRAMEVRLRAPQGGFLSHTEDPRAAGFFHDALVPIEDNAIAARALLRLARLSHDDEVEAHLRELAIESLRAIARPDELRALGRMVGEPLLALEELESGFVILSVVGPDDPRTDALRRAAMDFTDPLRLVELGRSGASRYPYPGEPAIFLCSGEACSMPVTDPSELDASAHAFLER